MKTNSKITLTIGQLKKLVNETVFDQKELRALANESQWMSIEEYVKKNDLDLDEFLGCASTNGEPMPPDAKLPIDELDYYASNCEKSSKGYKQSKIFVFGIQWDTHDETTNPLPCRAKLTVPTPNGKVDKQGIHDYLYSIYKVEPLDFDWEDLTNDLPHGMFAPRWGEQVKEEEGDEAKASVDKEAMETKLYDVLKQEAMDFSSNYTNPLDLWDIDVITREDRDEYQAGGASPGSEYKYAVKWGYDAAVDIALEDHEWTYVMVYEESESEEELKNQYTFDDVVNIITQSHLRNRYEEIQCGSFEHGHFKYIVFVEKESKAKTTINENTKFTLTIGQLKKLVKESGMTIEDAFDQMEQDVRKAKYAYLKGEVEEASNTVFEIIEDAKKISNRLTETTGGPLMESADKSDVNDEAVQLAMEFAKVMDEVPNGIYNAIQSDDVANGKNCLAVVRGLLYAARECRDAFGSGKGVKGLDDFIISAQLFIDHWEEKLAPYLDVPFESKQHNKRK